ncbi:MAG: T9SS type A sorting domain-containing protein [Flavobacteriales bacterium]|nr:T9SS type A sorting domain-containing protein [Flavobacteriales bacterium]
MKQSVPAFKLPLVLFFLLFSSMIASAATYYWVGGNGTWDGVSPTFWSNASGGAPGAGPPTAGDTAIFDVNSFTQAGDTVYLSGNVFAAKVEWNGVANFPTFSQAYGDTLLLGGSLIIDPNMALDLHGTIKFNGSSGNHIIDTHSKLLDADIRFNGTAQWELASDLETLKNIILNQGNFNTKGYYLRCFVFDGHASQSLTRSLTLDSSYVRINDTWDMSSTTGLTFDAEQSVIEINKIPGQGNFFGGDLTYNEVTFYSGQVVATGDNQFNKLEIDSGYITFPAGATQSFNDFATNNVGFQVTINSDSPGTQTNLTSLSGKRVCMDNMYLSDIAFSGASCYSSASTDGGNNAGITFASCPPALSATITDTVHVTCNGASDGWAVVYPSGGTPPYSYHWDDPSIQTTDTAVGLAGGFFNVLVTDADNDSAWASVNINEPGLLNAGPIVNNLTCVGSCDGDANINPTGGVPPYSYLWDANAGNATTVSVNSLCLGFYLYTVTDNNGCSFSDTVFINDPPSPLALGMDKGDVLCNGSCDGFGVAQPTAGTPPYSFQWDINAGYQTNDTATGLCAGHYLVTVTDNNGCIAVDSVDVGEPSALSIGFNSGDALCSGACDGFAKANPSGGVPPYSFQWDSNAGSQTVDSVGSLCSGTYFVTVTDNNGCQSSNSIIITEPSVLTNAMTPVNGAMCPGSCDGSAKANPTGGVAPYTFQWDSNAGSQTVDSVGGLCAGTYLLTITDNNGCMIVDSAMINEPTPMYPIFNKGDALCAGACDGFAKVNPTGGVPPYSFQWDANAGNQTVDSVFGLCAGWYFISVTDNNGCFVVDSVEIMEPSAVMTSFGAVMGPQCNGGCDGYAKVLPTGGVAPYSFQWDINAGYQTVDSASGLCAGMYYVTVTDNNGCTAVDSITINEPGLLNASFNKGDVLCAGACNGFAKVNPAGGVAPYTFQWDSNAGSATVDSVGGLCIGWYHVTVTDNNGCFMADSVEIMEPSAVITSFGAVMGPQCNGGCDGYAKVLPTGGVAPYSFQWDINAGYQTVDSASGLCAGMYYVTVTDNNGCTAVDSISINEPGLLNASFNKGDVLCAGACDGFARVNPAGGVAPYTFQWDSNAGSATVDSVGGLCIGWYHVTITDNNGCFMADSVEIMEPPVITNAFTPVNAAACAGSCDGSAMANPSGGVAPYSFQWDINAGYQTTQTATNLCTGNYLVTISDNNGCTYVDSVFIGEPAAVMTTFNKGDVLCAGSCNGFAKVNPTGGTPPYSFLWDSNAGSATVDSVGGLCIGWYHVTVTDNNGCYMADSVEIMEPSAVITSFGAVMGPQCNGGCDGYAKVLPTGGVAPYSFQWDANAGNQTVDSAFGLCTGMYYVTVTDNNGCMAVDSISIAEPGLLTTAFNKGDLLCNGTCNGFAKVNPTGGVPPFSYQWDAAAGSATVDSVGGLCMGWYHVTVTDNNGCFTEDSVQIMQPNPIVINTNKGDELCAGACNGFARAMVSGGAAPYLYSWDDPQGQTTDSAFGLCPGNYHVTVTDNNGCMAIDSVLISGATSIITTVNGNDPNCSGACDGDANVNATGGVPPYTFQWDANAGNQNTQLATGLCAGMYYVTVTGSNGCSVVDSITLNDPPGMVITSINKTDVLCHASCNGTATVNFSGGTAPHTILWDDLSNSTSASVNALCAGWYHVTVTDNNGCFITDSVEITEPSDIVLTPSTSNATCGGANGSGTISVTGGVSPYTFQWPANAASQTTATANNLTSGNYLVMVSDANGCMDSVVVIINETGGPSLTVGKTDASCFGACDGTATANPSGGTTPYAYQWGPLTGNQTTQTATNLCKGLYYVTVTDGSGCSSVDTVSIMEPGEITMTFSETPASCQSYCDGTLMVTPVGGATPYGFLWDDPSAQTTQTAINLCPGAHNVTVTDANGCSATMGQAVSFTGSDPILTGQVKYSGGGASGLKVKVLKYMSGGVMPAVDSTYTDGSGNYSFPNLPAGTYILHARTDTILYPRTMNTFHDSTFQWNTATQFTLSCDDSTSKDITLVEVPLQNGQGRLAGTIVKGGTNKAGVFDVITGDPIPDVDITLRSKPAGMVKGNTKTDGSGRYEFFNIEPGDYDLWVDIPGLPMDSTYEVNVSANDSDFTELDFMVDSNSIYIPDDITTGRPTIPNVVTDLKAWPNPFRSNAMLIYGLKEDARVRLELVDLVGKTVSVVEDGFRKKGEHRQVITPDEHGLIPGVYLARLTVNGNVSTIRLVLME